MLKNSFNFSFLDKIGECFENSSINSLFGLDFIFDYETKTTYLIDCNYYPGYRELVNDIHSMLSDHIIHYWNKHNNEIKAK